MQRRTALDPTIKPFGASVRSLPRLFVLTAILALALAPSARADEPAAGGVVDVIQVSGYIDPVVAQFIDDAVTEADTAHDSAIVLQIDSPGAVVSDGRLARLVEHLRRASGTTV